MTRKDYQLIADAIRVARACWEPAQGETTAVINSIMHEISCALKRDNPRFDVQRFLVACGIPESEINQ